MSCDIGKYLDEVAGIIVKDYPRTPNIGQVTLYKINKEYPDSTKLIEDYLTEQVSNRSNQVHLKDGRQYPAEITGVTIEPNGLLTVATRNIKNDNVNIYKGVQIGTGVSTNGQYLAGLATIEDRLFKTAKYNRKVNRVVEPSGFNDFSKPLSAATIYANKYVSNMMIGGAVSGGSLLGPHIRRWHKEAKASSHIYSEVVGAISTGFGNEELLNAIRATLNASGDMSRKALADLTNVSELSARRTLELLDSALPKLDKTIEREVKSKVHKDRLDMVFGTSGFANLYNIDGLIASLEEGSIDESPKDRGARIDTAINSLNASKVEQDSAKLLKDYLVHRNVGGTNVQNAGPNRKVGALAALLALKENNYAGYETLIYMKDTHPAIYTNLRQLSGSVKTLSDVINNNATSIRFGSGSGVQYNGYDGHYTMDVFENTHKFKVISKEDMDREQYKDKTPWKVLRVATDRNPGIMYKQSAESDMKGLGTNENRITNGIGLDKTYVEIMVKEHGESWLQSNNVVYDNDNGPKRYRIVLNSTEFKAAGGMNSVAHRLFRSYTHNLGLIETESARKMIVDKMTTRVNRAGLQRLEEKIKRNRGADKKYEIKAFLNTGLTKEELAKDFPFVNKMYKRTENASNYGKFHEEVPFVRRDMSDMVMGHKQSLIASDNWPRTQEWERVYKQLVQMLKLKLVVANPAKLGVDMLSNLGILMTMDVSPIDVYKYSKQAVEYTDEMSKLEGALVQAKLELSLAEVERNEAVTNRALQKAEKIQAEIEAHPFYEAIKRGFIQSMGTSMMIKEFDTVSGLQHTIDEVVKKVVQDKEGNPNEVHRAIKWWMDAGYGANDMLDAVGNISSIKGTGFSQELIDIGDRLKDKKQREDTVRYVGEFIAAPSSEVIRQGSRLMQMGDVAARWALFNHRVEQAHINNGKKLVGSELEAVRSEASIEALDTFIDYRLNMPKEIKALSDYGILMFPSFWVRAQKIIFNLAKYHPLNAGGGYLTADLLEMHGASILDANILSKLGNDTLVNMGQNVFTPQTVILGY